MDIPEEVKFITPWLQLAEELEEREPVIAYYCEYYALKQAFSKASKVKACQSFFSEFMDYLEGKKSEGFLPEESVSVELIRVFALRMVKKAEQDANDLQAFSSAMDDSLFIQQTAIAKKYLAAGQLFETLRCFSGVGEEEISKFVKYSKLMAAKTFKAAQAAKDHSDGRLLSGGTTDENYNASYEDKNKGYSDKANYGNSSDNSSSDSASNASFNASSNSSLNSTSRTSVNASSNESFDASSDTSVRSSSNTSTDTSSHSSTSAPLIPNSQQHTPSSNPINATPSTSVSFDDMQNAQKYCRYAISALQFEDIKTAVDNLQKALSLLTSHK